MKSDSQRIIEKILSSELRDESSIEDLPESLNFEQAVEMVIQLDSQTSATIKIHPNDDPFLLAKAFCFEHSIDPRIINTLANNIKNIKNMEFNQTNLNKGKDYSSIVDKQNNSSLMNASHSINQSFNKGTGGSKNKNFGKSSTAKNDTTLMSNNDFSRRSVFDRLYQDSRKKKTVKNGLDESNQKDTRVIRSFLQSSQVSNDPCLLIYQKNIKAYQSALKKREELHQINQQKIMQKCTFKPQINSISQIIAKKLPQAYCSERKREKDIKRIQKYLEEKQKKQLAQCTFQPQILGKSRSRSKSAQRYKVLYQDSRIRQMKRKRSLKESQMSRKKQAVKINKISQSIVGNKNFFERLQQDEKKRQQKKVQIQYEIKEQKNKRPSTGRAPANRPRNISIGEHLYNQARIKSIQRNESNKSQSIKLTCKKSQEIYENTKKIAFEYIFTLLDSNQDGLISNTKIQLNRLPGQVLKLLAPLLIQMQEVNAQLDESQFVEALQRLFNSFSVSDKQTILSVFKFKNRFDQESPSFKPELNEKTLLWARENRPEKIDLYELWKQTEAQKQQRLQQIRAYKILSELQQCTFHPLLFR